MQEKMGNMKQTVSVYELTFQSGSEKGKHCCLVTVDDMEVLFNLDNALDIPWVKYKGKNISFLSKNGINSNEGSFSERFEGGFLYTCGLDNVSSCVANRPVHGSLHSRKTESFYYCVEEKSVVVGGVVRSTALFGANIELKREYTVTGACLKICDTVINRGFERAEYAVLYHINFGYPFLDECLSIQMSPTETQGVTPYSEEYIEDCFKITPAIAPQEMIYYHTLPKGQVQLINKRLNIACRMEYDTEIFPTLVEWKSMVKGDYALGIEPSTTKFEHLQTTALEQGESEKHCISISFQCT